MEEWQKAYLAGFLEADGFITVDRQKRTNKHQKQYYYYIVRAGVANRNLDLLKTIQKWVEDRGSIYDRKLNNKNPKWSNAWALRWNSNDVYWILKQIRPFMLMKYKQADLVMEMVELKRGTLALRKKKQKQQFRLMTKDYEQKLDRYTEIFHTVRSYNTLGPEYLENNGVNSGEVQTG